MTERYLNITQTANMLGLKVRTVRQWIKDGKILAVKYEASNRWLVPASEVGRILSGVRSNVDVNKD